MRAEATTVGAATIEQATSESLHGRANFPPKSSTALTTRKRGSRGGKRRGRHHGTMRKIHRAAHDRQDAWQVGDQANTVAVLTEDLEVLYGELRVKRAA
jgi:hypothetical protein